MMARYGGGAMDMRQHSGGALSANSLQFSPQAAISNENYFLLDPIQSPSSSMDFAGLNSFASQLTSEFSSSFLESTSQNSFTTNLDSAVGGILGQAQTQNGLLLPADEWSGTTNSVGANSSQQQQHSHQISSPNQGQSSLSQGSLAQSVVIDRKKPLQGSYEGCLAASQIGQEAFVAQPSSNSKDLNQGEDFQSGQGGLQGMVHQASFQGSQLPQGAALQLMYQNQGQKSDFQRGNMCQQPFLKPAIATNALELSSQDSFHEGQVAGQPLGFEHTQSLNQPVNFDVAQKPDLHSGIQGYRGAQGDSSVADYQATNQQAFRQIGQIVNQPMKLTGGGLPHQSGFQTDEGIQLMRGLGLQIQGKSPQTSLQAQMTNQYMNFSGQTVAGHHSPNITAQQSLLQAQTVADQHSSFHSQSTAQAQAVNQQAAVNQQSVYQARQLPSGGHQQLFHASEQASFHSGQSLVKQAHVMSNNQGLHLHGAQQMLAQLQPRLLNPIFQGLKAGRRQILPGSSTGGATFFGSGAEGTQRSPMPGAIVSRCVQVLLMYIQEQRKRPADNDILFWRNLVREFFVPGATKRWCLTSYNSSPMGRHAQGLFPMDYWFCNLCGVQPGRGFESSTDVLPRLFKIKYDSGLMEELLFLDMAEERYMLPSGKLVLEFPQAVHESIFPELRVVRYGRLKVTFSSSFKISSWEFCTKIHEEVVPRKNLLQQAQQLAKLVIDTDQEGFDENAGILKSHCNEFTSTAKQLALKLDAPNVNDLGFSKRYVRCLQIAEVVNSMKDLISFERKTGLGPIESLARFPTIRKMQSETSLLEASHGTMNQVINQFTQGTPNGNSAYAQLLSRPSLPQTQGQVSNQLQSSLLQGIDNPVSRSSTSLNQLQIQFRNHLEARNSSLLQQQFSSQMQPPAVQSESCNQLTHFTTQEMSPLQSQLLSQAQSQLSSQASGQLSLNFGQMGQQIYESAGTKQIVHHHSNQVLSQSHSLNQAGQQSLPGTPQSEMSDMRSNA